MILKTIIFDIDFYVSSINVDVIIIIFLTKLNFHDFTFLITKDASIKLSEKHRFIYIRIMLRILLCEINE